MGPLRNDAKGSGVAAKFVRQSIRYGQIRIAENVELRSVMMLEQRNHVAAHDVIPEIRRDVADPQPALGVTHIAVRQNEARQWFRVPAVPAALFVGDRAGTATRLECENVDQITVGFGVVGPEGNGLTMGSDGLLELPLVGQGHAEIVVGFGIVGLKGDGWR